MAKLLHGWVVKLEVAKKQFNHITMQPCIRLKATPQKGSVTRQMPVTNWREHKVGVPPTFAPWLVNNI